MSEAHQELRRSLRSARTDEAIRRLSGGGEILRAREAVRASLDALGWRRPDRSASLEGYADLARRGDESTLLASERVYPSIERLRRAIDREQLHLARELAEYTVPLDRVQLALAPSDLGRPLRFALGALLALLERASTETRVEVAAERCRLESLEDLRAWLRDPPLADDAPDSIARPAGSHRSARAVLAGAHTWCVAGHRSDRLIDALLERESLDGLIAVDRRGLRVVTARTDTHLAIGRERP